MRKAKNRATEKHFRDLAETFKVLGDETRVRILFALSQQELCVQEIAERLQMTQSAVSHQLRRLRDRNLVRYRKKGKMVYYTFDDVHIGSLFRQGLDHVKHT
jgi:DNA-binding transcriptional ArsR family regulator